MPVKQHFSKQAPQQIVPAVTPEAPVKKCTLYHYKVTNYWNFFIEKHHQTNLCLLK
jgi:hypothetical protein